MKSLQYGQDQDPLFDNRIDSLMTIQDVSRFLKISEGTIRDWIFKRKIPFRKIGRAIRFKQSEIERWINQ